jgi:hypothetical protein
MRGMPPAESGRPARVGPVAHGPSPDLAPLAGFTVAVTAARRAEEICGLLERRGAAVLHAPALRIVPLADDTDLHQATVDLIAAPPDIVVATTGIGFRGWMEAAEGWGEADRLRTALGHATLLARGPKACGAIRAAGLREQWSPASESSAEVLQRLLSGGPLRGRRIAVQLHGEPLHDFTDALRNAGATVVRVAVYRWMAPTTWRPWTGCSTRSPPGRWTRSRSPARSPRAACSAGPPSPAGTGSCLKRCAAGWSPRAPAR